MRKLGTKYEVKSFKSSGALLKNLTCILLLVFIGYKAGEIIVNIFINLSYSGTLEFIERRAWFVPLFTIFSGLLLSSFSIFLILHMIFFLQRKEYIHLYEDKFIYPGNGRYCLPECKTVYYSEIVSMKVEDARLLTGRGITIHRYFLYINTSDGKKHWICYDDYEIETLIEIAKCIEKKTNVRIKWCIPLDDISWLNQEDSHH